MQNAFLPVLTPDCQFACPLGCGYKHKYANASDNHLSVSVTSICRVRNASNPAPAQE